MVYKSNLLDSLQHPLSSVTWNRSFISLANSIFKKLLFQFWLLLAFVPFVWQKFNLHIQMLQLKGKSTSFLKQYLKKGKKSTKLNCQGTKYCLEIIPPKQVCYYFQQKTSKRGGGWEEQGGVGRTRFDTASPNLKLTWQHCGLKIRSIKTSSATKRKK